METSSATPDTATPPPSLSIEQLKAQPQDSAAYFYNLGTLLFQQGQYGQADAYLEKARRLMPQDSRIEINARLAHEKLASLIGESRIDPASNDWEKLAQTLPAAPIEAALAVTVLITSFLTARRFRAERNLRSTLQSRPAIFMGLSALTLLGLSWVEAGLGQRPAAACLEPQVVRSGPGDHYIDLGRVEAGTRVRLTGDTLPDESDPNLIWQQVRFSSEEIGWVRAANLLLL